VQYCASFSVMVPLDALSPELRQRIEELSAQQRARTGIAAVNFVQQTVEEQCFNTEQERDAFERARAVAPRPQQ
jgi:ferritin